MKKKLVLLTMVALLVIGGGIAWGTCTHWTQIEPDQRKWSFDELTIIHGDDGQIGITTYTPTSDYCEDNLPYDTTQFDQIALYQPDQGGRCPNNSCDNGNNDGHNGGDTGICGEGNGQQENEGHSNIGCNHHGGTQDIDESDDRCHCTCNDGTDFTTCW